MITALFPFSTLVRKRSINRILPHLNGSSQSWWV